MAMPNKVVVEIFNEKYALFCDREGEDEHLKKLAAQVDRRMKEIYQATKLSSALKLAVLTALNFADEVSSKKELQEKTNSSEMTRQILNLVDKMENLMKEGHEKQ